MPIRELSANIAPELIFGLVAPIGVDLEIVSETLNTMLHEMNYSAHLLRLTKLMRTPELKVSAQRSDDLSAERSHIDSYYERIAHANALRGRFGDSVLAAIAVSAIRSFRRAQREGKPGTLSAPEQQDEPLQSQAYIIRQLKRPEEVELLRQIYGRQFILISAYAPQEWRIRRLEQLEKRSKGGLISDIEAHTRASELVLQDAMQTEDPHGQNLRDAFPLGDVFVDATSRPQCEREFSRFMHLLFGSNEITPTRDEYGMYLAKSASLRSSDLYGKSEPQFSDQPEKFLSWAAMKFPRQEGELIGPEILGMLGTSSMEQIRMKSERHRFWWIS